MKSNNIKYIEDSLKRYIKKSKDISYSTALLVAFLITGFVSYSSEPVQMLSTRSELAEKILNEKFRVNSELKEAEKNIKNIDLKIEKLMRRGRFWVKPLEDSYQIFFNFSWHNNSKNRNRTKFNFSGPEYKASPSLLSSAEKETYYDGIYYGMEGIIKNPLEFTDAIDFGANISPKKVEEKTVIPPTVGKTEVKLATIKAPEVPNIVVAAPEVTTPAAGAPVTPTAPDINVTAPGTITPLGQITVAEIAPLNVNVATPTISEPLEIIAPTVQTPATPAGFEPSIILTPAAPAVPAAPGISLFDPVRLSFNGTGFGQGYTPSTNQSGLYLENYDTYNTTAPVYLTYTANGRTMTGGTVQVTTGGVAKTPLTPGNSSSQGVYFISDAADHSVTINGDYHITRASDLGKGTLYFVSLNPYEVGHNKNTDGVYNFAGNLTLYGHKNPNSNNLLLGFEHQLLANNGGGSGHYTNVENGTVTSILKNTGTVTLADGYNIVGIQIDTEYNSTSNGYFRKQPQTINDGKIIINSKNSIGIDYGWYYNAAPNTNLHLGNIEVNGENNYGFRMKSYADKTEGKVYYDKTNIDGSNGIIKIRGNKNVGVSIAQGQSTDDPIGRITALNIEVGGINNIGFYRNPDSTAGINTNAMTLNSTTLGNTFTFDSSAIGSVLVRSDKNEVILDRDFTGATAINGIGEKNSLMQAGGTGTTTFASGKTATATAKEFYGMTAGNFEPDVANKTSGATAVNKGTLEISGDGSIAMAADGDKATSKNNTIENQGKIKFSGSKGTGIYNLGTFSQNANGELEISGSENIGLYNTGTSTIEGKAKIEGTNGSIGIYSKGGVVEYKGTTPLVISIDDSSSLDKKTLAAFASEGAQIKINNAQISVNDGAVGLIAAGKDSSNNGSKIEAKGATIKYSGKGYAVYAEDSGKIDITNARLELGGKATGMELDLSGTPSVTATGASIHVKSNDVTVYNLSNVSTALNVSTLQNDLNSASGVTSITADTGIDKYKLASLDGGVVNIDTAIGKTDAVNTPGHTFFKRFSNQRIKLNVNADVTAIMDTDTATANYNGQVVGLEMNSSKKATSVNETQINIASGKTLKADRTDTGAGAIGAFINYGKVSVNENSKILVEKEENTVNDKAAGIYAVNGSIVENKGTIEVGGNQSIGILGMAYRLDNKALIVNEFGGAAANQGLVNITNENKSKILMSGDNAIGIYAENNNTASAITDHSVINKGNIEIGNSSDSSTAIGIYAKGVAVKPESGMISVGKNAIGIYALDSEIGEADKDLGTVKFKEDKGIAIYLTGDQDKTKLNGTKITLETPDSKKENVGIFIDYTSNVVHMKQL